jgi:hypothetical protein
MTRDREGAPEPPTLHLSAEELRAYLAQARVRDVDTSMATQLFVHPRHAAAAPIDVPPPPASARPSRAPRAAEPRTQIARPLQSLQRDLPPSDATRTCFAAPGYVARPRLGERSEEPLPVADDRDSHAGTERLLAHELSHRSIHEGPRARSRAAALVLRARTTVRRALSRPRTGALAVACVAVVALMLALLTMRPSDQQAMASGVRGAAQGQAAVAPAPTARSSMPAASAPSDPPSRAVTSAPVQPVAQVSPAPDAALPGVIELVPVPPLASPPRRALDLLLSGQARDALDAYRALAREPEAAPVFAHVVKLLELEAQRCAARGDVSCR